MPEPKMLRVRAGIRDLGMCQLQKEPVGMREIKQNGVNK